MGGARELPAAQQCHERADRSEDCKDRCGHGQLLCVTVVVVLSAVTSEVAIREDWVEAGCRREITRSGRRGIGPGRIAESAAKPISVRIAFITSSHFSELYEDDRLAAAELIRRGHSVAPVIWTETDRAALDAFDVLVMRTPWDWFHHRARFRAFLEQLVEVNARVVNEPSQLLAFADKSYLPVLQKLGVPVVPSELLTATDLVRVPELLAKHGWDQAVLKPAFTANAVGARKFVAADARQVLAELTNAQEAAPWLLQPFVPSIVEGELSFVFFGGVFSHAVRKRPRVDEWRVQSEYGGQSAPHAASPAEIAEATEILRRSAPGVVYGRVDAVEWKGKLHLMELELVEPELFFRHSANAPALFADALFPSPFGRGSG